MNAEIDVRSALPAIRVPTLVIYRSDDARIKIGGGRYLAEKIPGAKFVEMPGRDHPIWTGDVDRVVDEIEEFLTGTRPVPDHERVLATIVVARLVAPERLAVRLGERLWSARIEAFREAAKQIIARHNGQPCGEGVAEITRSVCRTGARRPLRGRDFAKPPAGSIFRLVRACMPAKSKFKTIRPAGFPIHVAGRIAARAAADEILVSGVVERSHRRLWPCISSNTDRPVRRDATRLCACSRS